MSRYQLAPTKTNALKVKQNLAFAREGYELMEEKRQILVGEMMSLAERTREAEEALDREMAEAYRALHQTIVEMGKNALYQTANAVNLAADIAVSGKRVMGVHLPLVEVKTGPGGPFHSLLGTSAWMDAAGGRFRALLLSLGRLAQLRLSVLRLAQEVKKTVRRVNSLEKIAIPDMTETLRYVQQVLEEQDRENLFILKLLKARIGRKKERAHSRS
jgi:V/A-type H+-transporting ATPase subunit D